MLRALVVKPARQGREPFLAKDIASSGRGDPKRALSERMADVSDGVVALAERNDLLANRILLADAG